MDTTHRKGEIMELGNGMAVVADLLDAPAPCGYCRRCVIHDDPGGCLTVEAWEREQDPAALARDAEARAELATSQDDREFWQRQAARWWSVS